MIKITHNGMKTVNTVKLCLKDSYGNDMMIQLNPGECIYSPFEVWGNAIRVYEKKQIIEIVKENLPETLEYFKVYKISKIKEAKELVEKWEKSGLLEGLKPQAQTKEEEPKSTSVNAPSLFDPNPKQEIKEIIDIDPTVLEKAKKEVKTYKEKEGQRGPGRPKKGETIKKKSKKRVGRPKKRGPKKGSKRKTE